MSEDKRESLEEVARDIVIQCLGSALDESMKDLATRVISKYMSTTIRKEVERTRTIKDKCPSCGCSLFIGEGNWITCTGISCKTIGFEEMLKGEVERECGALVEALSCFNKCSMPTHKKTITGAMMSVRCNVCQECAINETLEAYKRRVKCNT